MKKVYLLILVSLILLLAFTACAKKHEHDFAAATCESPAKCSCGETQGEALGHDLTAATCTTPATCNRCGQTDGSALGHNWLDATCTAPKTCSTCKTTEGAPAGHKNDIVLNAVAPSCSATGLTEGVKCSACGTVTTEQEVVQKLPHTEEILEAVESTCSEAGLTEGKKCSVCGEVLVAQQPTDKKAHTEVTLPGKAATCEETGLTEGKQCSVCKEITVKQDIIPLAAHTEQTLGGFAATCTTPGKTDGKMCSVCETILVYQEDIPASHQNVVDKPGHPASCTDRGLTDGKYCEACSTWIVEQEPILDEAPGHDTADTGRITDQSPATCQADGYYEWTIGCWNCNYTETIRVTPDSDDDPAGVGLDNLKQLDHVFTNYVYNNDATCYADGTKTAVCDLCKDFPEPVSDTVTAEGTQREHLEPTNVACGEHWECQYEDCDYVSPDALEHQMVEKTCTEYAYCERNNGCTYVDVAGGYADHTRGESVEENRVEPKCEVAGSYDEVYYCTVCETHVIERITRTLDPLVHVWGDPTCSEPSKCTLCDVAKDGSTPRASHKLVMSYEDDLVYSCKYCDEITFTVDTQKFVFDGSSHDGMSGSVLKDKYTTESGTDKPLVATDAKGNQYYQMVKLVDSTGTNSASEQSQIWIPYHCSSTATGTRHFTELKEGAVGVLSFDINYGMNQDFQIYLCEGVPEGLSWYDVSGLGRINSTVISISRVREKTVGDTTVKYVDVTGWNNKVIASYDYKEDDILTAYGATGWFNVTIGLSIANDYVTAHYYINGDYVTSQAVELTTENNSITTAYINAYTQAKDSGYLLDNLAFGYTKDATWVFDACTHANKTGVITAPGCETQGYTTYNCPDCKLVWKDDYEDATNHNYVTVPAQDSTCTVQGWNEFTYCSNCQTEEEVKAENLLGLADHTPGEAVKENIVNETCIAVGSYDSVVYCSVCKTHEISRTKVEVDEVDGHLNLVTVEGYDSTCYATGYTDGEKCEACGVTTVQQEVIEKKAHTLVEYGAVPSDEPCKTPSILAGKKCSVEGCDHIEYEPSEAPLVAHTEVDIPAQPSTCTVAGKTAGKQCSVCGTVTVEPQTAELAPHDYTEQFGAVISEKPCETAHTLPGIRCSVCKAVQSEPYADALAAHTYDETSDTPRTCTICGYERACDHANVNILPAVAATCYSTGLTEGKQCADCEEIITAQTVTPMIAHTLVEYGAVTSAQPCKTAHIIAGEKCSVEGCGYIKSAPYAAELEEHTAQTVDAVPATCVATGLTEGSKCSVCDTVLVAQETTSMIPHLNDITLDAVPATCTETGLTAGTKCSACGNTTKAQEVTNSLGHLNDVVLPAVPATCTETGLTAGVQCSRCGVATTPQEEIAELGHNFSAATCDSPEICQREGCGVEGAPALANHTLAISYADNTLTYKCTTCEANSFNIDTTDSKKSVYLDGSANMTTQVYLPNEGTVFTSNTPVDGYYDFTQKSEDTTRQQAQLWIKHYASGLTGFSAANNAVGFFSAKLNLNFNYVNGDAKDNLSIKLVESHTQVKDGNTVISGYHWDSPEGSIKDNLFHITPIVEDGVTTGYNMVTWSNSKVLEPKGDGNWSGWFNIAVGIELDEVADMVIAHYYIDGEYWYSASRPLTTSADSLTSVYMNLNTYGQGTGYYLDDLAFGYVANSEWTFDECDHTYGDTTTVDPTCTVNGYDESICTLCGYAKRENIVNALGHTATPSCMEAVNCSVCGEKAYDALNHNVVLTNVDGKPVYDCTRCDVNFTLNEVKVYATGENTNGLTATDSRNQQCTDTQGSNVPDIITDTDGNKYYQYERNEDNSSTVQCQTWIPGQLTGLDFALNNSASGVISFKMKINLGTGEALSMRLADCVPVTGGSWHSSEGGAIAGNVLYIASNTSGGTVTYTIKSFNQVIKQIAVTPVADDNESEYTDWFDIKMALVSDKANGKLIVHYYFNNEYVLSETTNFNTKNLRISSIYMNANLKYAGSGVRFDDLVVGYTNFEHWTLDGQEHVITPATACNAPETCSCGWVGAALDHDLTAATCTSPATCKDCGNVVGDRLTHTLGETTYANGILTYGCTDCNNAFSTEKLFYADGTDYSNISWVDQYDYYEGTGNNPEIENGAYKYIQSAEDSTSVRQAQVWIAAHAGTASTEANALTNLTAADNSVGFLSFKVNLKFTVAGDNLSITLARGGIPTGGTSWYSTGGQVSAQVIRFVPNADFTGIRVQKWQTSGSSYTDIMTKTYGTDGFSGWIDVKVGLILGNDGTNNTITAVYYIDGQYMDAVTRTLETEDGIISRAYLNMNTHNKGTGYYMDDIAFGATANGHWAFDGVDNGEHVMTAGGCGTAPTCSCGWTGVAVASHTWTGTATCTQGQICSACGAEGERLAHTVSATLAGTTATYSCSTCERTFVPAVSVSGDGSSTEYLGTEAKSPNIDLTTATADSNSYYSVLNTTGTAASSWVWLNGTGANGPARLPDFSCANNSSGVLSFRLNLQGDSTTQLDIRPSHGRGLDGTLWKDHDGNGDNWNDCVFYLMSFNKGNGTATTRNITSPYGTVGTINLNEWVNFTVKIQLHDDGTMDLDYYINGTLTLSVVGTDMPLSLEHISGVMFQLSSTTANTGYLLDDFVLGYGNTVDSHWTLDGNDHELVSDKATCDSGIKCSCGQTIGAKLGHNIDTAVTYDAATNTLVYSCERDGCTHTIEMTGYYNDGTNKDNLSDTTAAKSYFTATANEGDGYYTLIQNATTGTQFEIWVPSQSNPDFMQDFSCANNAFGILAFKVNAYTTSGFTFQAVSERGTGNWGWANSNEIFGISGVSNGTVNLTGLSDKQNSNRSTLKSISVTDNWTGWLDVVITIQMCDDGKFTATYYVNGENIGTVTRTVQAYQRFTAMYISGNSSAIDSGIMLDEFSFAYTVPEA